MRFLYFFKELLFIVQIARLWNVITEGFNGFIFENEDIDLIKFVVNFEQNFHVNINCEKLIIFLQYEDLERIKYFRQPLEIIFYLHI